jgi:16S rRNA C1402 (ribose-2'-O) methylase RsmI
VVRELTKIYEEYNYKTVDELLEDYESRPSVKGEIVVVVAGKSEKGKT